MLSTCAEHQNKNPPPKGRVNIKSCSGRLLLLVIHSQKQNLDFKIETALEVYANVPPFLRQTVVRSSTASSNESVCSTS